jgi:hypothetical protein
MRIKNKKVAREHLVNASKALDRLKTAQEALFEWGDDQNLSEAESPGEDAWGAIECLGETVDSVEDALNDFEAALDEE